MPNKELKHTHSPVPWRYDDGSIRGAKGEYIYDVYMSESPSQYSGQDNAHFTVLAVNNHDQLVEALESILLELEGADYPEDINHIEMINSIKQALNQSKGNN